MIPPGSEARRRSPISPTALCPQGTGAEGAPGAEVLGGGADGRRFGAGRRTEQRRGRRGEGQRVGAAGGERRHQTLTLEQSNPIAHYGQSEGWGLGKLIRDQFWSQSVGLGGI